MKEEKRLNEKFFEHEARGNARLARKYQRQIFALDDVLEDMYEEGGSKSTEGSGDDRFKGASDKRLNEIIGELEKKGGFEDEVQNIKDELERRTPTEAATDEAAAATDEAAAATDEAAATTDEAEKPLRDFKEPGKVIRQLTKRIGKDIKRATDPQAALDKLKAQFGEGGNKLEEVLSDVSPEDHDRIKDVIGEIVAGQEKNRS